MWMLCASFFLKTGWQSCWLDENGNYSLELQLGKFFEM